MEPRRGNTTKTLSLDSVSTTQKRIAGLARKLTGKPILTLAHHIDLALLRDAYAMARKDGAPGVDGVIAAEYEQELEKNLQRLLDGFKSGTYKAPPVRRRTFRRLMEASDHWGSRPSRTRSCNAP
jgi:retron-type reverse transcriptase